MTGKSRWEEKEERLYHRKLHGMNSTKETKKEVVTTVRKEEVTEEEAIVREIGLEDGMQREEESINIEEYQNMSGKIIVEERKDVRDVKYAFEKNPNLAGKVRREGLKECVIKEAEKTSNKTEIGRVCGCSPRTVFRILVEESNAERCSNCGRVLKDTEPGDICDYCGTEV